MTMALQVFTDMMALLWRHPLLSGLVLVLFTPPFFPIVKFFSPLLISTALFMLALFTMGGPETSSSTSDQQSHEENWEFRRAADVKVWEDKSVGTTPKRRKGDGSWLDWLQSIAESGYAWMETKLQNENWKGSSLNDDNVSILQEASWATSKSEADPSSSTGGVTEAPTEDINTRVPAAISPSVLFKVDSKLKAELVANAKRAMDVEDLGEDAPVLEDVVENHVVLVPPQAQSSKPASSVHHEPLVTLEIPNKTVGIPTFESPSTDLDSSDLDRSKRFLFSTVKKNSMNASSGLSMTSESDFDSTPAAVTLSKSGKFKQIETLGDFIEEIEKGGHHEEVPSVLKPTTAEQVDAVKEKLEGFTHSPEHHVVITESKQLPSPANPGSPLFKGGKGVGKKMLKKSSGAFSDDSSSSGEEELSDSDSDSEFEIFPPVDPAKMKLHPPVKLDIQQLEKKLGTSLSQRTRAPKGEITEVQ